MLPYNRNLVGTKEIAAYTGYSERYVRELIVHHPEFPSPIIAGERKRRWLSDQVADFFKKERKFNKSNLGETAHKLHNNNITI